MRSRSLRTLFGVVAGLLVAGPLAGQVPDRTAPPRPGPPPPLRLPAIQQRALSNGLPVLLVEMHQVPVVQVTLLVRAGASDDPAGKFGVASLTAAMLDEGAGGRTALEMADALDFLGASLSTSSSYDVSTVSLWAPVARVDQALPFMADVAMRPAFPTADLERMKKERLTSLLQARDDAQSVVELAFPRIVYGAERRYGTAVVGTSAAIATLSQDDLRGFYASHYGPANASLVVVGDVRPDSIVPKLDASFGKWMSEARAASAPRVAGTEAAGPDTRTVYLIDKPGAPQSQIRIGGPGVARSTPDYFPIVVMNTILGGSFTSRLNQNLREEHGYTYGAGSGFAMRLAPGPFVAGAGVQTDKTADALREFFKELDGILQPVPAEELARARNYVALGFPAGFETTREVSGKLVEMLAYHLPESYFGSYVQSVEAVTAADVQRVARKYIQPGKLAVVVVGDREAIEPNIRALDLGPVKVLTVDDVLGPAVR